MAAHCVSSAAIAGISHFRCRKSTQIGAKGLNFPATISLQSFKLRQFPQKHSPIRATISPSLPYSDEEALFALEKVPKWSSKAIKSVALAELEARKLKHYTTGSDALIMGISIEGTNKASKFLWENGITLFKVREQTIKIRGESDYFNIVPERPPLSEDAQKALDWAFNEKLKSGDDGEITTTHLLLGVWSQEGSTGHKVLTALGFTDEKAQQLKALISIPGFKDD